MGIKNKKQNSKQEQNDRTNNRNRLYGSRNQGKSDDWSIGHQDRNSSARRTDSECSAEEAGRQMLAEHRQRRDLTEKQNYVWSGTELSEPYHLGPRGTQVK